MPPRLGCTAIEPVVVGVVAGTDFVGAGVIDVHPDNSNRIARIKAIGFIDYHLQHH